jgi:Ca2+-binding RTX toxin-like protein
MGALAAAAPSSDPSFRLVTDGGVQAAVADGSTVYLGGLFNYIGPRTGGLVSLSQASGANTQRFPDVDGRVGTLTPDGAGGWYVGGQFTSVGGVARTNLAHVLADGSVDTAWAPPAPNGGIGAIAFAGGRVYIAGGFSLLGSDPMSGMAALDPTTGERISSFSGSPGVSSFAVDGTTLWVGGFSGGTGFLFGMDAASGATTVSMPTPNSVVSTVVKDGDSLWVGGSFTSVGGVPRSRIAEIDIPSRQVTTWNHGVTISSVRRIALSPTTVYATGQFAGRIVGLDRATGASTAFNPAPQIAGFGSTAGGSVAYVDGVVYYSDEFTSIGGQQRPYLAALDPDTGATLAWNPGLNFAADTLIPDGGDLLVGGQFTSASGATRKNFAAVDVDSGAVTAWAPTANDTVSSLARAGTTIYAGGRFTTVNGEPHSRLVALHSGSGATLPWAAGVSSTTFPTSATVASLATDGSTIYAGGFFDTTTGGPRASLAAFDAAGSLTTFAADLTRFGSTGQANSLVLDGTDLFVGGAFTTVGGQPRANLAAVDATTGAVDPAWQADTSDIVTALALDGGDLYVGGRFNQLDGAARTALGSVAAATGDVTAFAPQLAFLQFGNVNGVAAGSGLVYISGNFTIRNGILAISAATGSPDPWNPTPSGIGAARVLLPLGSSLFAASVTVALFEPSAVADMDGDGVADSVDNCPAVSNADQANADGDSLGDACDPDANGDAIADTLQPSGTPAGSFVDDTGDLETTAGSVTAGSDFTIEDEPDPAGVKVTTNGDASVLLAMCPGPEQYSVEIGGHSSVVLTCGSITVAQVLGGSVKVTATGTTTSVTFAPGSTGTVTRQGSTVSVSGASGDVTMSVGGVSAPVPAGDSSLIQGGSGNTTINGTPGSDVIIDTGGNNVIDGRGGSDSITIGGTGNNRVFGGAGNDTIVTAAGNDEINGGDGNDSINAGNGNNSVLGGAGNDSISAGSGNDAIDGGAGTDTCNAGGGKNSIKSCP